MPISRAELQAIFRATDMLRECLIISRFIGPNGAAKVIPKEAVINHIPKISKISTYDQILSSIKINYQQKILSYNYTGLLLSI